MVGSGAFGFIPLAVRRLWKRGKERMPQGPLFVSMNDYRIHRLADVPLVWWEGMRLRQAWPQTDGAVGLWFCALQARRTISVSIWLGAEDLKTFVRSPQHVRIMQRHKNTGDLITSQWTIEAFDSEAVWRQALERLAASDT
jgi:hypothetical protein